MMLTGIYTGTAADTAVNIINLLMDTHYAEIVEVCLHTVVWTSGNCNLDMVVGREDQLLDLSCQLVGIYITLIQCAFPIQDMMLRAPMVG